MKIVFSILMLCSLVTYSQDTIFFKNGSYTESKILKLSEKTISYRTDLEDNEAVVYEISWRKVEYIKFENGRIEDASVFEMETANLEKANLLELNLFDLAARKVGINYEIFPTKSRSWSITLPARISITNNSMDHWAHRPWFELGISPNVYLLRKNSHNFSAGVEVNYTFSEYTHWVWSEEMTYSMEITEQVHFVGFYGKLNYKYNFKPRLGLDLGLAYGWRQRVNKTTHALEQGKITCGIFWRF